MQRVASRSAAAGRASQPDRVEGILAAWATVRPDLDATPMGVVARISRLARFFERRTAVVLAEFGLDEPQFGVLAALRRAGPPYRLSPTELFQSLMITSGAMTNRLNRLERAKLVSRQQDENDGRSMLVLLTPKGRATIDRAVEAHLANESRLLEWLDASEREMLLRALRKLLGCFEADEA